MHRYKLSVIVPCFRVAPYIERCARSLFAQTLDCMQFIFVDDCSEDDTIPRLEALLDEFPHVRWHTVIVRHDENKGLPTARKTGMLYAQGEYIAHCDSDDYVEPTMYELLYNVARLKEADMVECGYWQDNGHFWRKRKASPSRDSGMADLLSGSMRPFVWCRIVRADRYEGVRFPTASYLEDWFVLVQLLHNCSRRVVLDTPLYYYCFNPTSLTRLSDAEICRRKVRESLENYAFIHDFIMQHYPVAEKDFDRTKINICLIFLPTWVATGDPSWRKAFLSTFPEITPAVLFNPRLPWNYKKIYLEVLTGTYPLLANLRELYRKTRARLTRR